MISPIDSLDQTDAGADTTRRFRYQAGIAALYCLDLLRNGDEDPSVELYCEQREDILIRRKTGTYIGVQVKTRLLTTGQLKAGDDAVLNAMARFFKLEQDFGSQFARYVFATNHTFFAERETSSNLRHLVQLAKGNTSKNVTASFIKKVKKSYRDTAKIPIECCIAALSKVIAEDTLPKFEDLESRIATQIHRCLPKSNLTHPQLLTAAQQLLTKCEIAGSLQGGTYTMYLNLSADAQAETKDLIQQKRIVLADINAIIDQQSRTIPDLTLDSKSILASLPRGSDVLTKKLTLGGVSAAGIEVAKDNLTSAEYLVIEWSHKLDSSKARAQCAQIENIIKNICHQVYLEKKTDISLFGQAMELEIIKRVRQRHADTPQQFFGCTAEHLLGIVSAITQDCFLWWSKKMDLTP